MVEKVAEVSSAMDLARHIDDQNNRWTVNVRSCTLGREMAGTMAAAALATAAAAEVSVVAAAVAAAAVAVADVMVVAVAMAAAACSR